MYAVYRELHPPTGVEHCLECHFFSLRGRRNLVVAATSLLRVYELQNCMAPLPRSGPGNRGGSKLVQVAEYRLHGNVESMEKVQLAQSKRESLLLSFRDAKLSVVEWDPEINDIKTLSLHTFEEDELRGGLLYNRHRPVVRVDPEQRCAAMLIYGTHLAILPFRHGAILDEHEPTSPILQSERQDVLPSYTVELGSLSEKVYNVKDLQFLHSYNSPTLFILYEPTPTWAGRISLRKDTCCIVAISLNTSERVSPVIWRTHMLPFDSCYAVPMPRPTAGILVVGANSLIYLNQSSPSLGISLNSITDNTTNFSLKKPGNLVITMDCSQAVFVSSEQVVVSLKGGEIYVLTLIPDGMRGVKNILFEKAAAGVLASCICTVGQDFLFLGSRLGNSLLLGYSAKARDKGDAMEPPPVKRLKSEDLLDLDELEVYGADSHSGPTLASYKFEVCDSILNVAPIADVTMGEPAFLSEEFSDRADPDLELVTCSGHGKNGALCVLQCGVRPQVVTTFELPGCCDMWTVMSGSDQTQDGSSPKEHAFLILTRQDSTMVLQTGQEITELDNSGFATQTPTVFAGNIGGGRYILQVTCTDVRLLKGVTQVCRIPLDMGGGVRSCDLADPYAIVLLVDGTIAVLRLSEEEEVSLQISWPDPVKGSKVTLLSAYMDTSGLFATEQWVEPHLMSGPTHLTTPTAVKQEPRTSVDEEDELLYGDLSAVLKREERLPSTTEREPSPLQTDEGKGEGLAPPTTHWCALCREDGSLEVYKVPQFTLVLSIRNFSSAPKTLMDSGPVSLPSASPGSTQHHSSDQVVEEVLLVGLGPSGSRPHLLALVEKELVVYRAFPCPSQNSGHLQLRFSKVQHKVLLHDRKDPRLAKQLSQQEEEEEGHRLSPRLRVFNDIAGYSGVFVCGPYPHWLIMTHRSALHLHPMFIDGPISTFASFNNVNCPKGFLYFNSEGELRICVLPSHLSYDSPWPVRKVPTRITPHYISYHMESKTHAVVTSEPSPVCEVPGEDPEQKEPVEKDERFVLPSEDSFHLQLYSPSNWEAVPNTRYGLERFDRVTAMKVMQLRSQETLSGRKEFIVLGATSVCGEDSFCKGKILIFDVTEVIPEPGKPLTKHKLKCLYNQEQKGTISALEAVDGLLLACMGQKIFMWNFKDNKDLVGVAFIDADIYVHTASVIKNFILTGDITHSIQLLRYQENLKTLSLVSKDPFPMDTFACNYLIDGQQLGFLVSDSDQNLILYQYQPELPETSGGLYLTRQGDFNSGAHISTFLRVRCRSAAPLGSSHEMQVLMADKRHVTYFATLDGGVGYLLPIAEKTFRRLSMLQVRLVQGLPHVAGLNPKAFRMFKSRHQYLYNPQRNIIDGDLLWKYTQLSSKEKTDFAKQIGTTPAQIFEDLKEVDKVTSHF